jgi:hypothetical protein
VLFNKSPITSIVASIKHIHFYLALGAPFAL